MQIRFLETLTLSLPWKFDVLQGWTLKNPSKISIFTTWKFSRIFKEFWFFFKLLSNFIKDFWIFSRIFEDFQGFSRIFWDFNYSTLDLESKFLDKPCLEVQGISRITIEISLNFLTLQPLPWIWRNSKIIPLTWKKLELQGQGQGSLLVKVSSGHPSVEESLD